MSRLSKYPVTLDGNRVDEKRKEIRDYFHNTYELFEKVFEVLKSDDVFYEKSEATRHPMIFYFGHTATFFINKLISMKIISERINPDFESIFAVGVDEMSWDDMDGSNYSWPEVDEVRAYRGKVKELVDELISTLALSLPIKDDSPMWVILMGIEHERIHVETSLVLHRQMPIDLVQNIEEFNLCDISGDAQINSLVDISAAGVELGKEKSHNLYGWDNEYGTYTESTESFQASKFLVSNSEYMEFVKAGAYENEEYWDDEGRKFLKASGATHPPFWVEENGSYRYRALTSIIDMPYSWPVDVNALEAEAFCRYKSEKEGVTFQLPSEAEYRAIYDETGLEDIPTFHESRANLNFYHYASSCPVDEFSFLTKSGKAIYDIVGNVWQWSRTPIRGFEGFEVHPAYDDFSTPTFDEKHALILGSSWASSGNLIMRYSRYAFRKHFYQNAGFRYVVTNTKEREVQDIYESDELVSQYCEFQYGDENFGVKNFAVECAKIASVFTKNKNKALDLGCATGRATYELAKSFDEVEGIDFSVRFVQVGSKLKDDGYVAFTSKEEGDLVTKKKVTIEELGYDSLKERVSFWQGDACNMKPNFTEYDLVMATNLIDRLYNPRLFLDTIHERLNREGVLVITSPYTWQESSTKKEFWLGGKVDESGEELKTIDSLKAVLEEKFELMHLQDLEFVIKETARKYQHTISQVSVWQKKVSYDFSTSACRKDTNAEKYTLREKLFGTEDVEPVWVADMDINTPDFVLNAVSERLKHPIIGYEEVPRSAFEAQVEWMKKEHGITYEVEDMLYSHSVVASMSVAIEAYSELGDKVIVQTPVYPPFFHSVTHSKRKVLKNPLKQIEDGSYIFDIEDLKSKIDENTKLLLLCSPHNPVGRVWRREELEQILEVCLQNNIVVFSDEIHSDLVYAPNRHIPFASLSEKAREITVTAIGVGKTFNMAGFAMSSVAIQNRELREKFKEVYKRIHFAEGSVLSHVAFESAYKNGKPWLEDLKEHLYGNYKMLEEVCKKYPKVIKVTPIEATYLAWLDCRGMGLRDRALRTFFVEEAKLGLNAGISFGREGSGFMRLNFALSRAKMSQIVKQLENALEQRFGRVE